MKAKKVKSVEPHNKAHVRIYVEPAGLEQHIALGRRFLEWSEQPTSTDLDQFLSILVCPRAMFRRLRDIGYPEFDIQYDTAMQNISKNLKALWQESNFSKDYVTKFLPYHDKEFKEEEAKLRAELSQRVTDKLTKSADGNIQYEIVKVISTI